MRASVESFARRWWGGELGGVGRGLSMVTAPLSWAWVGASTLAGARRAGRARRVDDLAVISVGNLAVGGTGKTPFVTWLAERLAETGERPAVLVGGHAADEALLHAEALPGVPVVEDRDRLAGAERALAVGASVALLDDGFQHRQLARDLDIVLLAAEDRFPGAVLPRGPYREPPSALARAHVVVVTRRTASADEARAVAARVGAQGTGWVVAGVELAPGLWRRLDGGPSEAPSGDVLAACGIGRPRHFRSSVGRRVGGTVELVAFSDHHVYTPADVARLARHAAGRPLVITEKDAVKLRAHAGTLGECYVLSEEMRWDWGEEALLARVRAACARVEPA